jgi:hypothetical protein
MIASGRSNSFTRLIACPKTTLTLALVCLSASAPASVIYVNKNAAGATHDGHSWSTAFQTIQAGVGVAVSGDEVWVAASAPAAPNYAEWGIGVKTGVAVYGGFSGTETARKQRDWMVNVTVVQSNAYVFSCNGGASLDGFVIRSDTEAVGAGGSPIASIANCTIESSAVGVYVSSGGVSVRHCAIRGNSIGVHVYGFYDGKGVAYVTDSDISGNVVGVSVDVGTAMIEDCTLRGNTRDGIHVGNIDGGAATVTNCILSHNATGINVYWGFVTATNCTLSDNSSYGIYASNGGVSLTNSIVAFNPDGICWPPQRAMMFSHNDVYGNEVGNYTSTSRYSTVTDPTGTDGNISADPLFRDRLAADYHPSSTSPCIDAGDNDAVPAGERDADGRLRIIGLRNDIGAFESGAVGAYTIADAALALKSLGGLSAPGAGDFDHLNADRGGTSARSIDLYDVVWIVRRAVGLDPA